MTEHPERVNLPQHHLMTLDDVTDHLGVDPFEYLEWVIRGEAPPLNVLVDGESHILREDILFWCDSMRDGDIDDPPEDVLVLTLSLQEVADIFEISVGEYLSWVETGDAPPVSTLPDGSVGVVRAALDAWASDAPSPDDVLAMLRDNGDDILQALRDAGFNNPEQVLRDILGDD
jgi:hypothetical protein